MTAPAQNTNAISPALRPVVELEKILQDLLVEHHKLARHLDVQQDAMQRLAIKEMDYARVQQELCRTRVLGLEQRRKSQVKQIARINQLEGEPKIPQLATMYPQRASQLLQLQADLRSVMRDVESKSFIATKLATAVLGHLNTAMRILSGAVGGGGMYTKRGTPRLASRIGLMEAVA
jgi:hypothetical protein